MFSVNSQNRIMEKLLETQKAAIEVLKLMNVNYGKANKERKSNASYIMNQLTKLSDWWSNFEATNTELLEYKEENEDQPYFSNDAFLQAQKMYEALRNVLVRTQGKIGTDAASKGIDKVQFDEINFDQVSIDSESESEYEVESDETAFKFLNIPAVVQENAGFKSLKLQLNDLIDIFEAIETQSKSNGMSWGFITAQTELLTSAWNDFRSKFQEERNKDNSQVAYIDFKQVQLTYTIQYGKLNDLKSNKNSSNNNHQLPKLKIPEFSGNTTDWPGFITLYDKIVHENQSINDALKVQYLKTSLKGDALKIINHVSPTAENYNMCYSLLRKRYDNKRAMMAKLFDKILFLPKQKFENSESLTIIHDTVNECVLAIKNMGIKTSTWSPLLNHIILRKLAAETVKD